MGWHAVKNNQSHTHTHTHDIKLDICFLWGSSPVVDGWLFGFYGISTVEGYLIPNPFLYK